MPQNIWKNFSIVNIFEIASIHPTKRWKYFETFVCHWNMFPVKLEQNNSPSATHASAILIENFI